MKYKCDKCNWHMKEVKGFGKSDYVICEKCGRLLVSHHRRDEILFNRVVAPRILMLSNDIESVRNLMQAMYDPRTIVSAGVVSDIKEGHGESELFISKDKKVVELMTLNNPDPHDRAMYRWVTEFDPHVVILKLDSTTKEDITDRIEFLKNEMNILRLISLVEVPVLVVLDNADMVEPAEIKEFDSYPDSKLISLIELKEYYLNRISLSGLTVDDIFPVSSYMKWGIKEDHDVSEGICAEDLKILRDGRYNINKLKRIINESSSSHRERFGDTWCRWM